MIMVVIYYENIKNYIDIFCWAIIAPGKYTCNSQRYKIMVGYSILNKLYNKKTISDFTYNDKPLFSANMHLLFNKKSPDSKALKDKFNEGLNK